MSPENVNVSDGLSPWRRNMVLTLILIAGAYVRLRGLGWGLPEVFEEATPWRQALEMWGGASGHLDFNPHFFNYPAFSFYIQWAGQALVYIAGRLTGDFSSVQDMLAYARSDPGRFILVGRLITSLFGVASIYLIYRVASEVFSRPAGLVAALFLAFNFSHIRRGQFIATDVPLVFFILLAFIPILMVARDGGRRHYIWAGVCVGLATGVKYPGALAVTGIVAAHVYRHLSAGRTLRRIIGDPRLWLSLGLVALVFLAVSPYCLLDYRGFLRDFGFERAHMRMGHFGAAGRYTSYGSYLLHIIPGVLTLPLALLAACGLGYGIARYRGPSAVLVAFPVVYFAAVGSWKTAADHYILPLVPFMLVFAGLLIWALSGRAPAARRHLVLGTAACLFAVPSVVEVHAYYARPERPDNRTLARAYIAGNIPRGSAIVREEYTPDLDPAEYLVFDLPLSALYPRSTEPFYDFRWYEDFDYAVISNEVYLRYLNDPGAYPVHVRFYRDLEANSTLVREFGDRSGTGPTIKIYRIRKPPGRRKREEFPPDLLGRIMASPDSRANARLMCNLANVLSQKGEYARAMRLYQVALEVDPSLTKAWYNLGLTLVNEGRPAEAEGAFKQAVRVDPAYALAYIGLGHLYRQAGDLGAAAEAYENALKHEPRRLDVIRSLIATYIESGRLDEALEWAEKAQGMGYDTAALRAEIEKAGVSKTGE
jgi:tetratricopeptide (TPR) repeat protein